MTKITRREALGAIMQSLPVVLLFPRLSGASGNFEVDHPLMPPSKAFSGQCPVCGMLRSMWARTWIRFDETDGISEVCSFHCMADFSLKSGELPAGIRLAVYHAPATLVAAEKATVVIGSSAKGTMSPKSKIVFDSDQEAAKFVRAYGGQPAAFGSALEIARSAVSRENAMLVKKRLKKGKIVAPAAGDRCPVCEMYPERYPENRCQVQTKDRKTSHFCSTQCLFAFLENPGKHGWPATGPHLVWVTDLPSGNWIGGRSAYYVVGAKDRFGPMGFEAFPFDRKNDASAFVNKNGGRLLLFKEVSIDKILR